MAYKKLTETGKEFILQVATLANNRKYGTQSLIKGNNGALPYSDKEDQPNLVWTANIVDIRNNNAITSNEQYANYLIYLYDRYAQEFGLDANIIAAQGYQESKYNAWIYVKKVGNFGSTASGVAQILMNTMHDALYASRFQFLTPSERNTITNGMTSPSLKRSWRRVEDSSLLVANDYVIQKANRSILHQNMIDNPHLCIKIQCGIMNYIANRNNNLASSTLFAYNRGSELSSKSYIGLINFTARKFGNNYIKEGVKYVQQIFGYLGDRNNQFISPLAKPKGIWFGYKLDLDTNNYSDFNANAKSS